MNPQANPQTNPPLKRQQVSRFHPALVALHWVLAALIIADLAIGSLVLVHIPNDLPRKIEGLRAHMSGGIAILVLMLVRLAVRAATATPAQASTGGAWLDRVAWLSHRLLYAAVFAMAASGLALGLQAHVPDVVWFGQGTLPADFWVFPLRSVHYALSRLLMALIGLHVAGALYHVFVRRDQLLRRMWFGRRTADGAALPPAPAAPVASALWRHAAVVERLMLAAPALLFAFIGWKYMSHPLDVAAGSTSCSARRPRSPIRAPPAPSFSRSGSRRCCRSSPRGGCWPDSSCSRSSSDA